MCIPSCVFCFCAKLSQTPYETVFYNVAPYLLMHLHTATRVYTLTPTKTYHEKQTEIGSMQVKRLNFMTLPCTPRSFVTDSSAWRLKLLFVLPETKRITFVVEQSRQSRSPSCTQSWMHISPCSPLSISSLSSLSSHIRQHSSTGHGNGISARSQRAHPPFGLESPAPQEDSFPNPDEIWDPPQSIKGKDLPYTKQLSTLLLTIDANYHWLLDTPPDATSNIWQFVDDPYVKGSFLLTCRSALKGNWRLLWQAWLRHRQWCELDRIEEDRQLFQEAQDRDDELANALVIEEESHHGTPSSSQSRPSRYGFWPYRYPAADIWTPSPQSQGYDSYQSS